MKRQIRVIIIILFILPSFQGRAGVRPSFSLDDIILDIYHAVTEFSEVDYEQLQTDLYALHDAPIDLNNTSDEELSQLYFLSPQQIDDILAYAGRHPFESLYELRLIPSLAEYEIRDLLPFVQIRNHKSEIINQKVYPREVFAHATHEIITRVDARNIEGVAGTDPMYVQGRYRFDYQRKVTFGAQLRRPVGGIAKDLQYGAYLQLRDITPHLHTVVGGNFQASFGQGLVLAPVFHSGKTSYVSSVGMQQQGLRYYSSVDGEGLHGAGATIRHAFSSQHLIGANLTLRHKRLEVQLTAIENLWSDSIHPYRNAKYNRHYFRGRNQAVIGASFRYNHGWFDAFGECAAAENYDHPSLQGGDGGRLTHWGLGALIGSRFYPTQGVSLVALYRYYSRTAITRRISITPWVTLSPRPRASTTRTAGTWVLRSPAGATGGSRVTEMCSISAATSTVWGMQLRRWDMMPWQNCSIIIPPFHHSAKRLIPSFPNGGFLSVSARGRKAMPPTPPVRSSIGLRAAGRCVPPRKPTSCLLTNPPFHHSAKRLIPPFFMASAWRRI